MVVVASLSDDAVEPPDGLVCATLSAMIGARVPIARPGPATGCRVSVGGSPETTSRVLLVDGATGPPLDGGLSELAASAAGAPSLGRAAGSSSEAETSDLAIPVSSSVRPGSPMDLLWDFGSIGAWADSVTAARPNPRVVAAPISKKTITQRRQKAALSRVNRRGLSLSIA